MLTYEGKSYVVPREAAQMFSIHLATVYNWCVRGQVTLLDPFRIKEALPSKYLIELESLKLRHAHVYLEDKE